MVQAARKTEKMKSLVKGKKSKKLHHQARNRRQNNKLPVHNHGQGLGTRLHSIYTGVYNMYLLHICRIKSFVNLLKSTRNSSYFNDTTLSGQTQKQTLCCSASPAPPCLEHPRHTDGFNIRISSTPFHLEACVPLFFPPPPSNWYSALCPQTPPVGTMNDVAG